MKIPKWVTYEQEVEVEIGIDDIIVGLACAADADARGRDLLRALNTCLSWVQKIPQSSIDEMQENQRKILADFMRKQADRFVSPEVRA